MVEDVGESRKGACGPVVVDDYAKSSWHESQNVLASSKGNSTVTLHYRLSDGQYSYIALQVVDGHLQMTAIHTSLTWFGGDYIHAHIVAGVANSIAIN